MDGPSGEQIGLAQYMGRRWARRSQQRGEPDDAAQDAVVALLHAWPRLSARYPDGVPNGIICALVTHRLTDRLRTVTGWKHKKRPRSTLPLLDAVLYVLPDPRADTERDALANVANVEDIIEEILPLAAAEATGRNRYVMEQVADGMPITEIAKELGMSYDAVRVLVLRFGVLLRRLQATE